MSATSLSLSDYERLFEAMAEHYAVLTPDFKIVSVTKSYAALTKQVPRELVGRDLFEAFPDNPNEKSSPTKTLRESIEKVIATGRPDSLEEIRYDFSAGRNFVQRYWRVANSPIFDDAKKLKYIVHGVVEITDAVELRKGNEHAAALLTADDKPGLFRIVTDNLPAFVSYMGTDHCYKFVNKVYCDWFGLNAKDIEGKTRSELLGDSATADFVLRHEEKAFRGETSRFELKLASRAGDDIFLDTEYIPDIDLLGQVRGIIGVGQDVTARKRALEEAIAARSRIEENEARYKSLSDSLPNLMWTYSVDGGVRYVNRQCGIYLGIEKADQFGVRFVERLHPDERDFVQLKWHEGLRSGELFKLEYQVMGIDGAYRWFLGQAQPIRNSAGATDYWIATATDVDDQRKISEELFNAKNAAENANRAKTEFLANMSHEIRTPLGAILGFSDLMRDPLLDSVSRDQYAATIARNGKLLIRIIDDILDLAKVESGRMEPEDVAFSLNELLNEVLALFEDSAKQKQVELRFETRDDALSWISSDPTRLRQILINVIGNAVKFTDQGSVIVSVAMRAAAAGKIAVAISVKDSGRGIPPQQRERLFKPFTQADTSTTRRYGGTGLGLALSRRLAEALGGTLDLAPEQPAKGAAFEIRILAKAATARAHEKAAATETARSSNVSDTNLPLEGVRVLLVDDSLDNQSLVRHVLKKMGAVVNTANNGIEGVKAALAQPHDVVLMDIQMPEMDGYQALATLKKEGFLTPVIALTAHALNEERVKTKDAGFAGHLTKPIDKTALLETLRAYRPV